jgi:hypothetical protein
MGRHRRRKPPLLARLRQLRSGRAEVALTAPEPEPIYTWVRGIMQTDGTAVLYTRERGFVIVEQDGGER